ncbi:hypothetical protein ABVT39_027312, partial [Epinephelus coioides]
MGSPKNPIGAPGCESRDLTVRATHAPLERTNPVAPPSCPPAAAGRSGGESRPERSINTHERKTKKTDKGAQRHRDRDRDRGRDTSRGAASAAAEISSGAFPACCPALSLLIEERVGAGVRADLAVRRREGGTEEAAHSSRHPPLCVWTPAVSADVE